MEGEVGENMKKISEQIFRKFVAETTMLDGLDQQLKGLLLEGAFTIPEGRWVNQRLPLLRAQQDLGRTWPDLEPKLTQLGWFARPNQPGYVNLYKHLRMFALSFGKSKGLDRLRSETALTDLLLRVGVRLKEGENPLISNARRTGVQFADRIKRGDTSPVDVLPYLRRAVKNQVLQILKDRKKDETKRFVPREDEEGKGSNDPFDRVQVERDLPSLADAVMSAFHDPTSSVGTFLRTKMRELFSSIYDKKQSRRPGAIQRYRPGVEFLDMMENNRNPSLSTTGEVVERLQVPNLSELGAKLGIKSRAIEEAHIKPLFRAFFKEMRENPQIRQPLTRFFEKNGYSKEEVQNFFERDNPFKIVGTTMGRPIIRL